MPRDRTPAVRAAAGLIALSVASACTVEPPDLSGKTCPCAPGYECVDGACTLSPACGPLVTVDGFRALWSTPHSILWTWTPSGRPEDFGEYQLVIAASEADVLATSGSARVVDRTINPELGYYITPHETGAVELTKTVTDGLDPLIAVDPKVGTYFAQLLATDVTGCTSKTGVVEARTKLEPVEGTIEIFRDELVGELWGAPLTVEPGTGMDGSAALRCGVDDCLDTDPESPTWDHLRLVQPVDLAGISENAIVTDGAFLEFWVAIVSEVPAFYTELYLENMTQPWLGWRRLHLRARPGTIDYQHVEVPLAELDFDTGALPTTSQLQRLHDGFQLGGSFPGATDVYLDSIAVRW